MAPLFIPHTAAVASLIILGSVISHCGYIHTFTYLFLNRLYIVFMVCEHEHMAPHFNYRACYGHRLRIHRCATRDTSPMISVSHRLRHIHTHFWQAHLFKFLNKCIKEKWFLRFCRFISDQDIHCLKYTGQLLFIYFYEPRQSSRKFS